MIYVLTIPLIYQPSIFENSTSLITGGSIRLGFFFAVVLQIFGFIVSFSVFTVRHHLILLSLIHCLTVSDSHIRIPNHIIVNKVATIVNSKENTPNHAKPRDNTAAPSTNVL